MDVNQAAAKNEYSQLFYSSRIDKGPIPEMFSKFESVALL